ncbi:MAG TPA: hypothetical protein VLB05_03000 [Dongiaceae bacterium]|nr:hypothetical protein [Dongiaceae bacterium]
MNVPNKPRVALGLAASVTVAVQNSKSSRPGHRSSIQHECAVMEIRSRTLAIPVARERAWCSGWQKALIAYWKIIQGRWGSAS